MLAGDVNLIAMIDVVEGGVVYFASASVQVRTMGLLVPLGVAAVPLGRGMYCSGELVEELEATELSICVHSWTISVGIHAVTVFQTVLVAITSLMITVELG